MTRHASLMSLFMACAFMLALPLAVHAENNATEHIGTAGYIDWTTQRAIATGTGLPQPEVTDIAHAHAAAKRAALLDARRNLLEVIRHVRIDSTTQVENLMTTSDSVRTSVSGALHGSVIDDIASQPNGSTIVTVSVPLTGDLARSLVPAPSNAHRVSRSLPDEFRDLKRFSSMESRIKGLEAALSQMHDMVEEARAQKNAPVTKPTLNTDALAERVNTLMQRIRTLEAKAKSDRLQMASAGPAPPIAPSTPTGPTLATTAAKTPNAAPLTPAVPRKPQVATLSPMVKATGIIIDARNSSFVPSMRPRITHRGNVLYPGENADFTTGTDSGFVRYYKDILSAQESERAGLSPLIVRAEGNGSDLEVSTQDAALLSGILARPRNALDQCRVVVVF